MSMGTDMTITDVYSVFTRGSSTLIGDVLDTSFCGRAQKVLRLSVPIMFTYGFGFLNQCICMLFAVSGIMCVFLCVYVCVWVHMWVCVYSSYT